MAQYKVQGPDGQVRVLEGPDGASDAQIAAAAEQAFGPKPSGPAPTRTEKVLQGARDPIDGGAQLLTKILPQGVVEAGNRFNNFLADKTGLVGRLPEGGVDQQVREGEATYQARRAAAGETGVDGYRLAGNVVSPVNIAAGAVIPRLATLGARAGVGAAAGAATGLLNPVTQGDYATEKGKQAALGSVFGAAAPVVGNALSRLVSPVASTNPQNALLRAAGVRPTVGQMLGGAANAAEEKLQSVPIVGDAITAARRRALGDFNEAAINRATEEVGATATGSGQRAVADAGDALSSAYNAALGQVRAVRLDGQFAQDFGQLQTMAQALVPSMRARFNAAAADIVGGRAGTTGTMTGETYKRVDSELGNMAARYGKSSVASESELGTALLQLQNLMRQQMGRSNPAVAQALDAADAGWANLVRVEGAAKAAKNAEGLFTPAQLNAAVQGADKSVRGRAVARGEALMQDLGNAGQQVLGNKYPDSGTVGRGLMAGGLGAAGWMEPLVVGSSLAGGAAVYSAPVQNLLRALVGNRPQAAQPIANALQRASIGLSPAAAQIGLSARE